MDKRRLDPERLTEDWEGNNNILRGKIDASEYKGETVMLFFFISLQ
jgi:hypothetical protein